MVFLIKYCFNSRRRADDVIANLKGHEDEFDAMVFSCGDAIPQFAQHANEPYNQDLMAVIAAFGQKGKIMIGHCAGAMLFDMAGVIDGKTIAVHPLAKSAIQKGFLVVIYCYKKSLT